MTDTAPSGAAPNSIEGTMQAPNYKAINQYAAHRVAPTQPPPPDAADHILKRVAEKRALIARLTAEADELEAVALRMRGAS